MGVLTRWFNVLPLRSAIASLRNDTLPMRAACVTFDDGYADNAEVALPILRQYLRARIGSGFKEIRQGNFSKGTRAHSFF